MATRPSKRKADDVILVPMVQAYRRRRAGVTDLRVPQVVAPGIAYVQARRNPNAPPINSPEEEPIPLPEADFIAIEDIIVVPDRTEARMKKIKEVNNWNNTLPLLVEPYSHLMMASNSMRHRITSTNMIPRCSCTRSKVSMVALIYMDRKS